jgi:hypothetical protein
MVYSPAKIGPARRHVVRGEEHGLRHLGEGMLREPMPAFGVRAATHFLMKTLPKVATEMALHVLAYNLTRVMNIVGIKPFLAAIRA